MRSRDAILEGGHAVRLLQGSREFFAALIEAFDAATTEIRLETYIFDVTGGGADVAAALERAAARGVRTWVLVDGFGTPSIPQTWSERLTRAGVAWHVYAPVGRFGILRPRNWRRLHRKLCLVDSWVAFCGGINVLDDYFDPNHGALEAPRFDFAVRVEGPLVAEVEAAMAQLWLRVTAARGARAGRFGRAVSALRRANRVVPPPAVGDGSASAAGTRAALILRDNVGNRTRIERAYLRAIRAAEREIVIANAYFVPGRRMRRALIDAARRGVRVRLLLQGRYEYFMQYYAARPVYEDLMAAGVEIHEYAPSFLHAKVAVMDGLSATVGSSNLDPLSLLLAREANVVVEDAAFSGALRDRLWQAASTDGALMDAAAFGKRSWSQRVKERIALGAMRLALALQGRRY